MPPNRFKLIGDRLVYLPEQKNVFIIKHSGVLYLPKSISVGKQHTGKRVEIIIKFVEEKKIDKEVNNDDIQK